LQKKFAFKSLIDATHARARVAVAGKLAVIPRIRNRIAVCPQVAGQIETPCPPDPIMQRSCADREEKRVT